MLRGSRAKRRRRSLARRSRLLLRRVPRQTGGGEEQIWKGVDLAERAGVEGSRKGGDSEVRREGAEDREREGESPADPATALNGTLRVDSVSCVKCPSQWRV